MQIRAFSIIKSSDKGNGLQGVSLQMRWRLTERFVLFNYHTWNRGYVFNYRHGGTLLGRDGWIKEFCILNHMRLIRGVLWCICILLRLGGIPWRLSLNCQTPLDSRCSKGDVFVVLYVPWKVHGKEYGILLWFINRLLFCLVCAKRAYIRSGVGC